jgi:hypothetical protein
MSGFSPLKDYLTKHDTIQQLTQAQGAIWDKDVRSLQLVPLQANKHRLIKVR